MLPRLPVILVMWSSFAMSYVNINSADSPETALLLLKKLGVRFEHDSDGRLAVIDATDSRISDDDVGLLNLLPPPPQFVPPQNDNYRPRAVVLDGHAESKSFNLAEIHL